MATITDINGKVHRLEDVEKVEWVDRNGDTIFTSDYGDTVSYVQDGVQKTKTLNESRRLLQVMDGFAYGDYSYMPKTLGDVVQGTALDMMTNSSGWTVGKAITTMVFGAAGTFAGNPALGISLGSFAANLGADIYLLGKAYSEDPNTFWSRYVQNIKDIAKGADSDKEPNATGWRRWLSEINTGASYVGMGGKSAVYETWDDIIGATPDYVSANVLGNLTRAVAAGIGGMPSYVIDQTFNDALREGTRIVGITNDVAQATKLGAIYGAVSGVSAGAFAKLPLANWWVFKKLSNSSPFWGTTIANGIEAAGAQLSYDAVQDIYDPTEADKTVADYGINAGIAFGTGALMAALPKTWQKFKFKDAENAAKNPTTNPSDMTVKEAVESKVVVDETVSDLKTTKPEVKETVEAVAAVETPKVETPVETTDALTHGKIKPLDEEQLSLIQRRTVLNKYRESVDIAERDMLKEMLPKSHKKQHSETYLKMKDMVTEKIFAGLSEDQQTAFLTRLGFSGNTAKRDFSRHTPLSDLLIWGEFDKSAVFDIPVYNPNMPVLTPQQSKDIIHGALKLINAGETIETAIFQSYCQQTKVAPDADEVAKFVNQLPESIRVFAKHPMDRVKEFMTENLPKKVWSNKPKQKSATKQKQENIQEVFSEMDVKKAAEENKWKDKTNTQ